MRCVHGISGREITEYKVIYGPCIQLWPTLVIRRVHIIRSIVSNAYFAVLNVSTYDPSLINIEQTFPTHTHTCMHAHTQVKKELPDATERFAKIDKDVKGVLSKFKAKKNCVECCNQVCKCVCGCGCGCVTACVLLCCHACDLLRHTNLSYSQLSYSQQLRQMHATFIGLARTVHVHRV